MVRWTFEFGQSNNMCCEISTFFSSPLKIWLTPANLFLFIFISPVQNTMATGALGQGVSLNDEFKNKNQLAISTTWKSTTETNKHNFCLENKLQMITWELASKYHEKFEHFLWERKNYFKCKINFCKINMLKLNVAP